MVMQLRDFIKLIGWLSIPAGPIVGFFAANAEDPLMDHLNPSYDDGFKWAFFFGWIAAGIILGVLFLALDRALGYLEEIMMYSRHNHESEQDLPARTAYPEYGKVTQKPTLESISQSKKYKFKSDD